MLSKMVDPFRLCKQGASMQGTLQLAELTRLQALCDQGAGTVTVSLQFNTNAHRLLFVEGNISGDIHLACQRCGKPMIEALDISFQLTPVVSDAQAKKLPEGFEPLWVEEGQVVIGSLVEDEILLALPMVPKHPENTQDGSCA